MAVINGQQYTLLGMHEDADESRFLLFGLGEVEPEAQLVTTLDWNVRRHTHKSRHLGPFGRRLREND